MILEGEVSRLILNLAVIGSIMGEADMGANPVSRKPMLVRDTSWLTVSEIISVLLALIGQVILTRAILQSEYGMWILLIDIFTAIFLIVDAGLPTLISRDGANNPFVLRKAVRKVWKLQLMVAVPFVLIGLPSVILRNNSPSELIYLAAIISLLHIASYAPRSALRAAGEARLEAVSKVVERTVITIGYTFLLLIENDSVFNYGLVFSIGSAVGFLSCVLLMHKFVPKNKDKLESLGESWTSTKSLVISALPFAMTLGILPYITRIEKFFLSGISLEFVAIFHVGQLAWMAGMIVPISISSALLPILGEHRLDRKRFLSEVDNSLKPIKILLVLGLIAGSVFVSLVLPLAFPEEYTLDGNNLNSVDVFIYLLSGWGFSLLAAPWNTAIKAGRNSWTYTLYVTLIVLLGTAGAWIFIPRYGLMGAVISANLTCFFMLFLGLLMSKDIGRVTQGYQKYSWILMLLLCLTYPIAWYIAKWVAITLAIMIGAKLQIIERLTVSVLLDSEE